MSEDVTRRRQYRSERRRAGAEETRRRILEAAAALFVERGYTGATLAAVARAAGVAEETVYAVFRNKRTLLAETVSHAVRGGDVAPVLEQERPRAVLAATDPREQVRMFADDMSQRLARAAPLMDVLAAAAPLEPELRALRARLHAARLRNIRAFVGALATNVDRGLDTDEASETAWALASPELYTLLTGTRRWSRARYASWLEQGLAAILLDAPGEVSPKT